MKLRFVSLFAILSLVLVPGLLIAQDADHSGSEDQTAQNSGQQESPDEETDILGAGPGAPAPSGGGTQQHGTSGPGMMGGGMMDMMGPGMMDMMGPGMMGGGMMDMMGSGMMGGMGGDPIQMLRQQLDLSDQQVTNLRQQWLEYIRTSAPVQANLRIAQAELQTALAGQQVNMQQVEQKIRQIQQLQGDLILARIRSFQQLKNVLTPQQLQQLQQRMGPGQGQGMMGPDRSGSGRGYGTGRGPWWGNEEEDD